MSYKLIKLDQTAPKDGSDPTPKFMLAGQDANEPLLPPGPSKHMRNRKVCHLQWTGIDNVSMTPSWVPTTLKNMFLLMCCAFTISC